jgi:hypothetical protein
VPHPRIGTQAIEDRRARQDRIDHREVRDLVAIRLGVRVGDHQPDVVPDERDRPLDPKMLAQEVVEVLRHRLLVITPDRTPGMPGTPIVGGHDTKAGVNERGHDVAPLPPRLRIAVQEHDRARSLPGGGEMKAQAGLDIGHAVLDVGHGAAPMVRRLSAART